MKNIIFVIIFVMLSSCSSTKDMKGTTWAFSTEEGTNTIVFGDTTYISTIDYGGKKEQKEFKYYLDGDTIRLGNFGENNFKAIVSLDKLVLYQSEKIKVDSITSFINEYTTTYIKQ